MDIVATNAVWNFKKAVGTSPAIAFTADSGTYKLRAYDNVSFTISGSPEINLETDVGVNLKDGSTSAWTFRVSNQSDPFANSDFTGRAVSVGSAAGMLHSSVAWHFRAQGGGYNHFFRWANNAPTVGIKSSTGDIFTHGALGASGSISTSGS